MVDYVTSDDGKGIYAYIDVETLEPVYVGKTSVSFKLRDNQHRYSLDNYCPFDKKLKNDQSKYVLIPIIYSDNPDTLNLMESYYIYAFDTIEKENRTWGGEIGLSGKNHPQYRHDINEDDVERLYFDEKLSAKQIAKILGCGSKTVQKRLHDKGLSLRSNGFARSLRSNKTGYYRVSKENDVTVKQGFLWYYRYYENGKRKKIRSVSLDKLEEKVKAKNLPWIKFDEEE